MKNKITIHYIWFENYKCFHNQGINLFSKYRFEFDPQNEKVYVEDNTDKFINDFFGENIDVTAIVGENGTGKTSILRFILSLSSGDYIEYPCVIVGEINNKFWAVGYYLKNNQIEYKKIDIDGVDIFEPAINQYDQQRFPFGKITRSIYLSEVFSESLFGKTYAGADDLSLASILYSQSINGDEDRSTTNPVARYIHRINDWQLNFIATGADFVQQFKILYPPQIQISFNYDTEAFTRWYISLNTNKKEYKENTDKALLFSANKLKKDFLQRDVYTDNNCVFIKDKIAEAIFMNIITSFDFVANMKKNQGQAIINMIEKMDTTSKYAWENVYKLLLQINKNNNEYNKNLNDKNQKLSEEAVVIPVNACEYIQFMDYFSEFVQDTDKYTYKRYYENTVWISTDNIETIQEFFNNYKQCVQVVDFLSFSWGLSSGETLLLNQFGKLMSRLKKTSNGKYYLPSDVNSDFPAKNAVIMLDEAEVAFHPEWQRSYFDAFLSFIRKNIADQGTHVQIIIATHSPIILSDIPKQNTVFLKRNEKETEAVDNPETFAANIFSLYQNAFFLDEAGIGCFAEKKLCELIDEIHQMYGDDKTRSDHEKEEVTKKIYCIGDPYIRHKFEMEYQYEVESAEGTKKALEKRIKDVEVQLNELKQQRNKLGE